MSFPNFGEAGQQPQQGGQEQGGMGAPGAQQTPNPMSQQMGQQMGQQMDPSQQQGQFQGGPQGGAPGGPGGSPGGDSKTTLWCVRWTFDDAKMMADVLQDGRARAMDR